MKIGNLLACGAMALLFLAACGGDTSASTSKSAAPTPAPTPTPAQTPTPTPTPTPAPTPAQAPTPAPTLAAAPDATAQNPAPTKRPAAVRIDFDMVKQLFGRDPSVAESVDNPSTPEKVALGKSLYESKHLSKGGDISCASCHDPSNYGQDGKAMSPGGGERNTPTIWNTSRQFTQYWDGRGKNVEEMAPGHVLSPTTHGLADEAQLVAKLKEQAELTAAFEKAFPGGDAVTAKNFGLAIGAFVRTLVTKSKFDAYLDGDQKALSNEEKAGLKLFIDKGCITCHTTRLVGGHMFQKTGLVNAYSSKDPGRAKITGSDADKHFFKVPTLLNVAKTAPYFHDGASATLEETVKKMGKLQLNLELKDDEVASIVTFLNALTGPLPAAAPK